MPALDTFSHVLQKEARQQQRLKALQEQLIANGICLFYNFGSNPTPKHIVCSEPESKIRDIESKNESVQAELSALKRRQRAKTKDTAQWGAQ